ncbi:hypothetical protein J8273_4705 [Carpediemonas membranifera]|uniref:Uncharacterized protein n=1 Tax=Carpediemonas membranifera TaxID=201153 RepID=A0A8J6B6H5_9EUKA|nr:hypothetical protein J8273_4705 [Carpediemonas membranifera]|eukprot:KAG9393842.1 hypothetical protein J8273_4705 [Carpediemonas membranifera]
MEWARSIDGAYSLTGSIAADIPGLLTKAFSLEYGDARDLLKPTPPLKRITSIPELTEGIESLSCETAAASALIEQIRQYLSNGPPLAVSVRPRPGRNLPATMYTLPHGTMWATLMRAGADPDLEGSEKVSCGDTKSAQLWFLCKKFHYSHKLAVSEGLVESVGVSPPTYFRMFAGRVFSRGDNGKGQTGLPQEDGRVLSQYGRVAIPLVSSLFVGSGTFALTPKGIFVWGRNDTIALGVDGLFSPVRRLAFPDAPAVAAFEQALPTWRKHELVCAMFVKNCFTVIRTPCGTIAAGTNRHGELGVGLPERRIRTFRQIPLPAGFSLESVDFHPSLGISTMMSGRVLIASGELHGAAGEGSTATAKFVRVPLPVDDCVWLEGAAFFVSGGGLFVAGVAPRVLRAYVPRDCPTPTSVTFPWDVEAVWVDGSLLICELRGGGIRLRFGSKESIITWETQGTIRGVFRGAWLPSYWLETDEALWAFGDNRDGCLGVGSDEKHVPTPTRVRLATGQMSGGSAVKRLDLGG